MSVDDPTASWATTQDSESPPLGQPAEETTGGEITTPPTAGSTPEPGPDGFDLSSHELYLNRELTWLNFNWRVLQQAEDYRVPLLERLRFVVIVSSNLDEFVMKRLGGLKQQVGAGLKELTVDGRTPAQQIEESNEVLQALRARLRELVSELRERLLAYGIRLASYTDLSDEEKSELRDHYLNNIFPLVTPQATDPAHPFPFISNLSINLLVTLRDQADRIVLTRVKAPIGSDLPGIVQVGESNTFVVLEEVMAQNLDLLFPGMEVIDCEFFRVVRNANTEREEDKADDLLAMIESELRDRRFAPVVRIDVLKGMSPEHQGMLAAELGLNETTDVDVVEPPLERADFMRMADLDFPELRDPPHHPIDHPELIADRNIFHVIREKGSIFLHHPYESFTTSVERFLKEASQDPKVRAIKMSLYRTARRSKVIKHLTDAARNGKQVAVVVELKARFDERANIEWARHLEEAGIHVTYGVVGLKTHCKLILVVRRDYDGLRRYTHFGTGNYHSVTARMYADLGLLTCDQGLGEDAGELFNYLTTGFVAKRKYKKLLTSPRQMKLALLYKIRREIELHSDKVPGYICLKMNALEDADITRALYEASQAGVRVDLIVRDTCRLRPGIPGLSENVRVISIVGRFLEHGRLYHFSAGGQAEYYIGSADCMTRNLESRVETLVPIREPGLQSELHRILDLQLNDCRGAWEMRPDGSYVLRQAEGDAGKSAIGSQQALIDLARKRRETKQKRLPRLFGRRPSRHRRNLGKR